MKGQVCCFGTLGGGAESRTGGGGGVDEREIENAVDIAARVVERWRLEIGIDIGAGVVERGLERRLKQVQAQWLKEVVEIDTRVAKKGVENAVEIGTGVAER